MAGVPGPQWSELNRVRLSPRSVFPCRTGLWPTVARRLHAGLRVEAVRGLCAAAPQPCRGCKIRRMSLVVCFGSRASMSLIGQAKYRSKCMNELTENRPQCDTSMHALGVTGPVAFAQLLLEYLARSAFWQSVKELHRFWDLETGQDGSA